jgi:hypothetical protein
MLIKYATNKASDHIQEIECIREDDDSVWFYLDCEKREYSTPKMGDWFQHHDSYEAAENFLRQREPMSDEERLMIAMEERMKDSMTIRQWGDQFRFPVPEKDSDNA